jgi:CelD/BcsL family acetyltransferase involved in cellulose biosynthesis
VALSAAVVEVSEALVAEWDRLATAARRPHSGPVWALGWWNHVRPAGAAMRLVAVRDGEELAGILPLVVSGQSVAPLGGDLVTVEPLAAAGQEAAVATEFVTALAGLGLSAPVLAVEFQDDSPDWGALLSEGWPGAKPARKQVERETPVPRLLLEGMDYEQWLASKSANFRKDIRRKARRLEKDGVTFRLTVAETLAADVAAFLELHLLRHPKGSSLAAPGVEAMLVEVGEKLLAQRRFRLVCVDAGGKVVAALLLSAAGGEVSAWNSGLSEDFEHHSPMMQCFDFAIREMAELGEECLNFGPGNQDYKYRLASEEGRLTTVTIIPRGDGYLRARARNALGRARAGAERSVRRGGGRVKRLGRSK